MKLVSSGDAETCSGELQQRLQSPGTELPGKHMAGLHDLPVVRAIVPHGDPLQRRLVDRLAVPLVRMRGAPREVDEMRRSVRELRGCKDGECCGQVMLVHVADAVVHAQGPCELGVVLAIGDHEEG